MKFRENIHKTNDKVGTLAIMVWLFAINNIIGLICDHQPTFMYCVPLILILINTVITLILNNISYENSTYD